MGLKQLFEQDFSVTYKAGDEKNTETCNITVSFWNDKTIFVESHDSDLVIDLKTLKQWVALIESKAGKVLYGEREKV